MLTIYNYTAIMWLCQIICQLFTGGALREKGKENENIVALLLAAIIAVGSLPAVFAASRPAPVIMVPGMGAELYQNAGTEEASTVWPPAFEWEDLAMIPYVLPAVRELISALLHPQSDLKPLVDALADAVQKGIIPWVKPLLCNPDGTGTDPSVDVAYHWDDSMANHPDYLDGTKGESAVVRALCEEIGAENVYLFTYDWRLDILTHADSLHTLIEKVKMTRALIASPLYRRVWEHVSFPHIWTGMDRTICKTVFSIFSISGRDDGWGTFHPPAGD